MLNMDADTWRLYRAVETRSGTDLRELVSNVNDYYGHQ